MPKTLEKPEVTEGFYYRDSDHMYFMDGKPMTGCTTILGVIAKPALIQWAANMVCEHINTNGQQVRAELLRNVEGIELRDAVTGEDILLVADKKLIEEARTAHAKKRDKGAEQGTDTHALVENYINFCIANDDGKAVDIPTPIIQSFIDWAIKENIRFIASEKQLYSKELWVAGTADLIFEKDGKTFLGDIKTYKKIWDRVPFIQCAGYALMWEEMNTRTEEWVAATAKIRPQIAGYCIINLPKERSFNESEDIKWSFDVEGDTNAFRAAVTLYRTLENF